MQKSDKRVVLRLRDLHRVYKVGIEKIHALKGVDIEIRENEYVADASQTVEDLETRLDEARANAEELGNSLAEIRNDLSAISSPLPKWTS